MAKLTSSGTAIVLGMLLTATPACAGYADMLSVQFSNKAEIVELPTFQFGNWSPSATYDIPTLGHIIDRSDRRAVTYAPSISVNLKTRWQPLSRPASMFLTLGMYDADDSGSFSYSPTETRVAFIPSFDGHNNNSFTANPNPVAWTFRHSLAAYDVAFGIKDEQQSGEWSFTRKVGLGYRRLSYTQQAHSDLVIAPFYTDLSAKLGTDYYRFIMGGGVRRRINDSLVFNVDADASLDKAEYNYSVFGHYSFSGTVTSDRKILQSGFMTTTLGLNTDLIYYISSHVGIALTGGMNYIADVPRPDYGDRAHEVPIIGVDTESQINFDVGLKLQVDM